SGGIAALLGLARGAAGLAAAAPSSASIAARTLLSELEVAWRSVRWRVVPVACAATALLRGAAALVPPAAGAAADDDTARTAGWPMLRSERSRGGVAAPGSVGVRGAGGSTRGAAAAGRGSSALGAPATAAVPRNPRPGARPAQAPG